MCCPDILAAEDQVWCSGKKKKKGLSLDLTVDFGILYIVLISLCLNGT